MDDGDLFKLQDYFERFAVGFALERFDAELLEVDADGRQGAPEAVLSSPRFGSIAVEATTIGEQASLLVDNELQNLELSPPWLAQSWQVWLGAPVRLNEAEAMVVELIRHAENLGITGSRRLPDPSPKVGEWRRRTGIRFQAFTTTTPPRIYFAPPTVTAWEPTAEVLDDWLQAAEWPICERKATKLVRTGADRRVLALRVDRSGVPDDRTWLSLAALEGDPLRSPPPVPDTVTDVLLAAWPALAHYWQRDAGWSVANCRNLGRATHDRQDVPKGHPGG